MIHNQFRIQDWLPRFSLEALRARKWPDGRPRSLNADIFTGPADICLIEQVRAVLRDKMDLGKGVPMDVFVMAKGEPNERHVTKLCGLPYRPADRAWPVMNGKPMEFLGQLCFADSKDICGELPGDVLLVFGHLHQGATPWTYAFEWYPLGLGHLVPAAAVPPQVVDRPCFGHIFRTVSFPQPERIFEDDCQEHLDLLLGFSVGCPYYLFQVQATQIGSLPFFIEDPPDLPGRLLGSISSVRSPYAEIVARPYFWLNEPEPLIEDWYGPGFGDMGALYLSIDDAGHVHAVDQCY